MTYAVETLRQIFSRTNGYCHICANRLAFTNYGILGQRGAWEVEHSKPRAKGGSDHMNNLYAACISCNREKKAMSTRTARSWHGRTRAPLSKEKYKQAKDENALAGVLIGGLVGLIGGPVLVALGAFVGGVVSYQTNPNKQ